MLHKLLLKLASGEELTPYYEAIKQWFSHHPQMKDALGEYYYYLQFVQNLKEADRIQARMPFDIRIK